LVDRLNFDPQIINNIFLVIPRHLYHLAYLINICLHEFLLLFPLVDHLLLFCNHLDQIVHLLSVLFVLIYEPRVLILQNLHLWLLQFQLLLDEGVDLSRLIEVHRRYFVLETVRFVGHFLRVVI
jgi:hypothetical protein